MRTQVAGKARSKPQAVAKRLTASGLDSLPSGTYGDPAQPGLNLRVREGKRTDSRSWLLRFKFRGEESRIVLGHYPQTSLAVARQLAQELRERARQGIDPRTARPRRIAVVSTLPASSALTSRHSIEFLAREFMSRFVTPGRKRPEYVQRMLDSDVLPEWKGRDARTIKPREVIELLDGIVDRGSPVAANRTAAVLGQMFKFGIQRTIVEISPVQLLLPPGGKERARSRALDDSEIAPLLAIKPLRRWEHMHRAINLLLLTGQRRGELALARWSDIDFDQKQWTIPDFNSKTGKTTIVPLSGWAMAELEELRRAAGQSPFLFPSDSDPRTAADPRLLTRNVARAQERFKALGIGAFTLHDLRRTCRTGLSRLKIQPHVAERVLGHAQEKIAGTYDVHDYLDEKRDALDKWANHLRGLQ